MSESRSVGAPRAMRAPRARNGVVAWSVPIVAAVALQVGIAGAEPAPSGAAIPAGAANCAVEQAPKDAGAYVTPGGFLLVYPRNAALTDDYTGCKSLWVVDSPQRINRLMTLYFERGKLRIAIAYDGRAPASPPRATCVLPGASPGCEDIDSNPLAALRLPTYPRSCTENADAPECSTDPE